MTVDQLGVVSTTAQIVARNSSRLDVYHMRIGLYANEHSNSRYLARDFEFYYRLGIVVDTIATERWPDWQRLFK